MRGINDDELCDFARLSIDRDWHVRFIELMPIGGMRDLTWEHVVPSDEILRRLEVISPLEPVSGPKRVNEPARYFRLKDASGTGRRRQRDARRA
jgi:cyclic pyranopterin phosphate synthase